MNTSGEVPTTISVISTQVLDWTDGVVGYLIEQGYSLSHITSDDQQHEALNAPYPDIIMGIGDVQSLSSLRAIHNETDHETTRPVFVLITDNYSGELPLDWADLVLPPTPHYIDYQLRTVLRLRAENTALVRSNRELKAQVDETRQHLLELQRDSDHIEILKTAIVHNVAHELNTPLLQVKSAVSLLAESAADRGEQEVLAARLATNATGRLESIIRNITRLSKAMDPNLGPVMLRHTFAAALRSLNRSWQPDRDIERIQANIPDDLPHLYADSEGLTIVLELLLDNALKFSRENATTPVELSAICDGETVEISIKDYGIGIPKDKWDRIFETFYQVDSSTTRSYGGIGVGLAIVRLILERHDTRVYVDSKPGAGSTFSFKLNVYSLK